MTKKIETQDVSLGEIKSDVSVTRKRLDRSELKRMLRNPLSLTSVLGVDLDHKNFVYRWAVHNDPKRAGRIEYLQALGYEIVHDTKQVGDIRSENPKITGSAIRQNAGSGKEFILMRIPTELHRENQSIKQEIVDDNSLGVVSQGQSKLGTETKIRGNTLN